MWRVGDAPHQLRGRSVFVFTFKDRTLCRGSNSVAFTAFFLLRTAAKSRQVCHCQWNEEEETRRSCIQKKEPFLPEFGTWTMISQARQQNKTFPRTNDAYSLHSYKKTACLRNFAFLFNIRGSDSRWKLARER